MNSLRRYLIIAGAIILAGILIAASKFLTPPVPAVGRFQLRSDTGKTPLIFDTATGRIFVLETNGSFIIRDPVFETKPKTFKPD